MAAPAPMPEPRPEPSSKPEVAIFVDCQVASQSDTIGIEIPLLNVDITEILAASRSTMTARLPSGQAALAITIAFRAIQDTVTVVANLVADRVKTIQIRQESRNYAEIVVEHRKSDYQYADANCTLQCSQGHAISASGHCIDCAGPRGKVRLCC